VFYLVFLWMGGTTASGLYPRDSTPTTAHYGPLSLPRPCRCHNIYRTCSRSFRCMRVTLQSPTFPSTFRQSFFILSSSLLVFFCFWRGLSSLPEMLSLRFSFLSARLHPCPIPTFLRDYLFARFFFLVLATPRALSHRLQSTLLAIPPIPPIFPFPLTPRTWQPFISPFHSGCPPPPCQVLFVPF